MKIITAKALAVNKKRNCNFILRIAFSFFFHIFAEFICIIFKMGLQYIERR